MIARFVFENYRSTSVISVLASLFTFVILTPETDAVVLIYLPDVCSNNPKLRRHDYKENTKSLRKARVVAMGRSIGANSELTMLSR